MTKENTEFLSGMREKMGLSKEQAEKIIKGVQNQRLLGGLEAAKNTGQLTLQKILDMKESGVEVDSFVSEEMRLSLFSKEVCSTQFLLEKEEKATLVGIHNRCLSEKIGNGSLSTC